ncbi:helix-turn-helix domain-containing protein [Sphingomonas sp. LHG3443-2]|uniref:helix-turn-helix domain-containing protein n=1 Tax=Sphingomonas sp. LHG3443-2 TaxID=2804639 RepID=UPI003CF4FF0D
MARERVTKRGYADLGDLRQLKGFTQGELSELVCTTQPRLSCWEAGRDRPSYDNLVALKTALEVTFDELHEALSKCRS